MFVALDNVGRRVTLTSHAQAAEVKEGGEAFVCPACTGRVRIRNGTQVPAHFAHYQHAVCVASEPESEEHLRGKLLLAKMGQQLGWTATLEVYVPEIQQRIDVLLTRGNDQLALEFQCSPISTRRLRERTAGYKKLGMRVRWLLGHRYEAQNQAVKFIRWHPELMFFTEHLDVRTGQLHQRGHQVSGRFYDRAVWPVLTRGHWVGGKTVSLPQRARQIQQGLIYRNPQMVRLQTSCYERKRNLAGCPWPVHVAQTKLLGLRLPEWALRCEWLLQFEGKRVTERANLEFWTQAITLSAMPLVKQRHLLAELVPAFCNVLVQAGYLEKNRKGWHWVKPLVWYADVDHKIIDVDWQQSDAKR